ncbi:hypothetical protein H6G89_05050 [Oscillatoria sp. FACHB-1407]|nr:hypothetical protein [Oscillatoria sp. FACHB-1407]
MVSGQSLIVKVNSGSGFRRLKPHLLEQNRPESVRQTLIFRSPRRWTSL